MLHVARAIAFIGAKRRCDSMPVDLSTAIAEPRLAPSIATPAALVFFTRNEATDGL
jgi:hypothetical protein